MPAGSMAIKPFRSPEATKHQTQHQERKHQPRGKCSRRVPSTVRPLLAGRFFRCRQIWNGVGGFTTNLLPSQPPSSSPPSAQDEAHAASARACLRTRLRPASLSSRIARPRTVRRTSRSRTHHQRQPERAQRPSALGPSPLRTRVSCRARSRCSNTGHGRIRTPPLPHGLRPTTRQAANRQHRNSRGVAAHQLDLAPSCVACRPYLCRAALPPSPPSRASRPPLFLVRSTNYDRSHRGEDKMITTGAPTATPALQ